MSDPTDIDSERDDAGAPRPALQRWGAILWPSFFAAGVATAVFFALVDPEDLRQITWADVEISRMAGYTIGFFMFWACTTASSLFTWMLLNAPERVLRRKLFPREPGSGSGERD